MNDRAPDREFFGPPQIPTEVECIHCRQVYSSSLIRWQPISEADPDHGFWCCPMPGCDGMGFLFDIWPTDPEWRDENGEKVIFEFDEEADEQTGDFGDADDSDNPIDPPADQPNWN